MTASRRSLIVSSDMFRDEVTSFVGQAGWIVTSADNFGHARFLMSMSAYDAVVVSDDLRLPEVLDGLKWLAGRAETPPLLVAPLVCERTHAAIDAGALWLPLDSARSCPSLVAHMLAQVSELGRQRSKTAYITESLRLTEARNDRLLNMLWEAAPGTGQTRWFTQRYMLERLDEEVARTRRNGTPLAVVLGELAAPPGVKLAAHVADHLVDWMSSRIAAVKRRSDVAGQYGRHGFILVMPQTTTEQAQGACRRLRHILAQPPQGPAGVQARFAIAQTAGEGESAPALLRRAEDGLELSA